MGKNNKFYTALSVIVAIVVVGWGYILLVHNSYTDRINPNIKETISYAKVVKNTQTYRNVTIKNPKSGKVLSYKLNKVGGYDPSKQYVAIDHKGQYVKSIRYISKQKYFNEG